MGVMELVILLLFVGLIITGVQAAPIAPAALKGWIVTIVCIIIALYLLGMLHLGHVPVLK